MAHVAERWLNRINITVRLKFTREARDARPFVLMLSDELRVAKNGALDLCDFRPDGSTR